MDKKKGYVVTHTHWDREWRYPIWQNRILLVQFFEELFKILDSDDDYACFVCDGQSIIIEDYLEVRPCDEEKIKKYIAEDRIKIGPWYTLPDLYPIDGECMVRNLLKGTRYCNSLGGHLQVGYNSFGWGQTAQFPQIYAGFGVDFVIAAKHVNKKRAPYSEFLWTAPDGTQVLTSRLGKDARANFFMNSYIKIMFDKEYKTPEYNYTYGQNGMLYHEANAGEAYKDYFNMFSKPSIHEKNIKEGFIKAWDAAEESVYKDERLIMNGSDFSTPQPYLTEILRKGNEMFDDLEFKSSTLEEYVDTLKKHIDMSKVPVVRGELRDGPSVSCSGNALMTRPRIKMLNKLVQNTLLLQAEPLSVMAKKLGGRYQKEMLALAIRYMLLSHAHDSLNGVTQDKTANDTVYNLEQALEIAQVVANDACGYILKQIDTSCYEDGEVLLAAFNSLPYDRKSVVKIAVDFPQELEVWDFDILDADGNKVPMQLISRDMRTIPVHDIESRPFPYYADRFVCYMEAEVPACGYNIYRVVPKEHLDRKIVFWKPMRKTDGKEIATDTNVLENEFIRAEVNGNGTVDIFDKRTGKKYSNLNYIEDTGDAGDYWIYYPPYDNKTFTSKGACADIYLTENGDLTATIAASYSVDGMPVKVYYTLEKGNPKLKVKLVVNNNKYNHRTSVCFDTGVKADIACAGGHFTIDKRPYRQEADEDGMYYNEMLTQPMQGFVSIGEFSVLSNCFIEYKPNDNGKLELTLFRAVKNMICTEFRSAGIFPDQHGGQSQGELVYEYAINLGEGNIYRENQMSTTPVKMIQTSHNKGTQPLKNSLIRLDGDVVISAIKEAEDDGSDIIRVFNTGDDTVDMALDGFDELSLVNLNEEFIEKTGKTIPVGSNKIVTVKVK